MDASRHKLLLGVDVGGTFTDAVLVTAAGITTAKRPTTADQSAGALEAIDAVLTATGATAGDVLRLAHGTTVATNALLERRLARTALLTTHGFGDMLEIARQDRPATFDLDEHRPVPLVPRDLCVEVVERSTPHGVELALTRVEIDRVVAKLSMLDGIEAIAVCLVHGWAHPGHERALAAALRSAFPHVDVVASHELSREVREYERACTTVIDASLVPMVRPYLERFAQRAESGGLPPPDVMQSSGGLGSWEEVAQHPARAVLSGPAGGLVAGATLRTASGATALACLDVGGTSSDVALITAEGEGRVADRVVAGLPIQLDMVDMQTIGAGGSSIVTLEAGGLVRVGPRSAGSRPGPASWLRGGSDLTLTDCHLIAGLICSDTLAHWGIDLDEDAARFAARSVLVSAASRAGCQRAVTDGDVVDLAHAAIHLAIEHMAEAVRSVTVARGEAPESLTLLAYGGAGGLHACKVATAIGCRTVLAPVHGGVVSAWGLALADRRASRSRTVLLPATVGQQSEQWNEAVAWIGEAAAQAVREVSGTDGEPRIAIAADCRLAGQLHSLRITAPMLSDPDHLDASLGALDSAFRSAHLARYGFDDGAPVEVAALHVSATIPAPGARDDSGESAEEAAQLPARRPLPDGGDAIDLPDGTLVVPDGWQVNGIENGCLVLDGGGAVDRSPIPTSHLRASILERRLGGICEEMGAALVHSARSPNITERRDSSCALFDGSGRLVAQAAHVPVHLGSMEHSVDAVLAAGASPNETWILNDPYDGGTHLPDITLVRCIAGEDGELLGAAAARAHHADVGGAHPGSMSPFCTSIDEEGVCISPQRFDPDGARHLVARMRAPNDRAGDLAAQVSALDVAQARLRRLADHLGTGLAGALDELATSAAQRARAALAPFVGARASAVRPVELPDGGTSRVRCHVHVTAQRLVIDLTTSDPQAPGSLNCPASVTRAAASCAMRTCLDPTLPAAACGLDVLDVITRPGTLVHAEHPAAVAGGNVEVSSVVFDCIQAALGAATGQLRADGQGTMNNLSLGSDAWTWYETIAGGQGASQNAAGADAVQVAMTNTRSTPVEVLETYLPVRVEQHAVRRGSGGAGMHRGGDGVVRTLRLLEPASISLLGQRRRSRPEGAAGGSPGMPGEHRVADELVPGAFEEQLPAGTTIEVRTPGGGGWGHPSAGDSKRPTDRTRAAAER